MLPFSTLEERNDQINDLAKEICIYSGLDDEENLKSNFLHYLNNGMYENKISELSNTEIEFIDMRDIIESTNMIKEHWSLYENSFKMGECEMFLYFYKYVSEEEYDLKDGDVAQYFALDHETGELELEVTSLELFFKLTEDEKKELLLYMDE